MRFDRALGDVQIASDFRVVTALQKQLDNLPLPWPHPVEILCHRSCTPARPGTDRCAHPYTLWIFLSQFAFMRPNYAPIVN